VVTSACGSGAAGANVDGAVNGISCGAFTACGGSILGTWRLVSSCGSVSSTACPSSERISAQTSAGQTAYSFAGDGTFTFTASGDVTELLRYPLACLGSITDAGIPQACADIERAFQAPPSDAGTPAAEVTSASCAAAANEICACTAVLRYTSPQTASGSYMTSGSQVTLSASASDGGVRDAGADAAWDYCVSGNILTLHILSSSADWVMTLTR
jgi:hypothetical protein